MIYWACLLENLGNTRNRTMFLEYAGTGRAFLGGSPRYGEGWRKGGTCRCKFLMRQMMPKPTSRMLVRVKALMALVSF